MAEVYKRLAQAQPSTSTGAIYTVASGYSAIVKSIRVVNTTSSSYTLTLYNGGTGVTNMILPATTIDGNGFGEFEGTITMASGDILYGATGAGTPANAIVVTVYGVEVN